MITPTWEYHSENILHLDKEGGRGWKMIGKDGWELVAIYTEHETSRPVPIIAVFKRRTN